MRIRRNHPVFVVWLVVLFFSGAGCIGIGTVFVEGKFLASTAKNVIKAKSIAENAVTLRAQLERHLFFPDDVPAWSLKRALSEIPDDWSLSTLNLGDDYRAHQDKLKHAWIQWLDVAQNATMLLKSARTEAEKTAVAGEYNQNSSKLFSEYMTLLHESTGMLQARFDNRSIEFLHWKQFAVYAFLAVMLLAGMPLWILQKRYPEMRLVWDKEESEKG